MVIVQSHRRDPGHGVVSGLGSRKVAEDEAARLNTQQALAFHARDHPRHLPGFRAIGDAWNSRRSSMPADSSPSCSKAVQIVATSASVTQSTITAWLSRRAKHQCLIEHDCWTVYLLLAIPRGSFAWRILIADSCYNGSSPPGDASPHELLALAGDHEDAVSG